MNTLRLKHIAKEEMFKLLKISQDKLFKVLLTVGNQYCHSESKDKWSKRNPTRGYCYKLSEVVSFRLKMLKTPHFIYQIKTKNSNHWFVVLEDNSIIDIMMVRGMQYNKGVRRNFYPCNTKSNMSFGAEAIAKGLGIL
jgi:hypothetical protein